MAFFTLHGACVSAERCLPGVGSGLPACQGRQRPAWLPAKGGGGQPAARPAPAMAAAALAALRPVVIHAQGQKGHITL